MIRVETIEGSIAEAAFADAVHHLEHQGQVEYVTLPEDDLARRRLLVETDAGREVAIALPREQKLFDGAVLHLSDALAIVLRAGEQKWLRLSPAGAADALQLGYHAGNLHWRVRFDHGDLLVALGGPAAAYLDRIEPLITAGRVVVCGEAR